MYLQLLLRRLDAVDIAFLVDKTSLLVVLEHQLAIAGARINGGGDVGLRMWRLLMVLVLHLGTEGHLLATKTVHRVLSSVRASSHPRTDVRVTYADACRISPSPASSRGKL